MIKFTKVFFFLPGRKEFVCVWMKRTRKIVIIARTKTLNYQQDLCHHRRRTNDVMNAYEFYATFLLKRGSKKSFQLSITFVLIVMLDSFLPRLRDEKLFWFGGGNGKAWSETTALVCSVVFSYDEGCLFEFVIREILEDFSSYEILNLKFSRQ